MTYYYNKTLSMPFDAAAAKTVDELKKEGFSVLTEIDIKGKLKEKLDVEFRRYKILGACNPALAYEALQKEDKIGLMLPCNVIVQETKDGQTEIAAINPVASMQAIQNPELEALASKVQTKLKKVIENL